MLSQAQPTPTVPTTIRNIPTYLPNSNVYTVYTTLSAIFISYSSIKTLIMYSVLSYSGSYRAALLDQPSLLYFNRR